MMAMAGLWETWTDGETGEVIESCTLLTTESNSAVRPVHDRMPVLLERRDYALWLDPDVREAERVVSLLVPSPPDQLEDIVVSEQVNSPRNDDPSCIAPA